MNSTSESNTPVRESENILFECPQCGKSLEIDARGAGYIVVCPECKNEIEVPAWSSGGGQDTEDLDSESRQRIQIEAMLSQLQAKVSRLEKARLADEQCFKRLADEFVLIQAALDRITEIVESRQAEG